MILAARMRRRAHGCTRRRKRGRERTKGSDNCNPGPWQPIEASRTLVVEASRSMGVVMVAEAVRRRARRAALRAPLEDRGQPLPAARGEGDMVAAGGAFGNPSSW